MTTRAVASLAVVALLGAACQAPRAARSGTAPARAEVAPAAHNRTPQPQDWFENEPEAAFAAATERNQLVFADLWAPWCHTCLSMQQQVLRPDKVPELGHVVALAVDTERAENEHFLQAYPVGVWPTFYVIDPRTGQVRARWLGGATAQQLSRFLKDASAADDGPAALLRGASALAAQQRFAEAEARYRAALATAPSGWPRRADALVALIASLLKQRRYTECLKVALESATSLPPSVSSVDFASTSLSCADKVPEEPQAAAVRKLVEGTLTRDCEVRAPGVSLDDHADACGNLRRARLALGDAAGARQAAQRALQVIEAGARNAPAETQLIYDWERTQNLVYLGRSAEAIALLLERERALPTSYNPPHYLARLYRDSAQWDAGLMAIERALSKAYGPRRIGLLGIKADLLKGGGRRDDARAVLQQQLAEYRALPAGLRQPGAEVAVEKRLSELDAVAPGRP
ncbi:MAG TPA: thioredoxin family protein [Polyangiaceae bacterium]|nr:thioredoxin family protein [Polyangiaceae bacterium]